MALGLAVGGSSGSFRPYVKYDARAGRLFRIDRAQGSDGTYSSSEVDITRDASFVADIANIRVGWLFYPKGAAPLKQLAVLGKEAIPPRPTDVGADGKPVYRQGFELLIKLSKSMGGVDGTVPRDLSSAAGCVIEAVDALHDAFSAAPESKAGKLPVVRLVDTVSVKSGQSTNYKPVFEIASWVDRPDDLPSSVATSGAIAAPASTTPAASSPPVTGSTQAPPPAAQAPQPATAGADDFG